MTIRSVAVVLAGAAVFAAVPATAAAAQANPGKWRFISQYKTLAACQGAGKNFVARRMAREYKCENDYTEAGAPALDLYVR